MIALLDNLSDRKIIYGKGGKFCDKLRLCCSIHSCIFTGGRLTLSPLPIFLFSRKSPGKCKLVSVCFGARKFSIKGENWITLILINDHDCKNSKILGK